MSNDPGILYVVATPIGNLGDISARAIDILGNADLVLAEDKRRTSQLFAHLGLHRPMLALHEHNERELVPQLVRRLQSGESMALVSDAGTPLISDPGYPLVSQLRQSGVPVVPIPGASALTAALSVAGLPTDRFVFEGFLPRSGRARAERLARIAEADCTSVVYESVHRIDHALTDLAEACGSDRRVVLLRELTKLHETVLSGELGSLRQQVEADSNQHKGELVLVIAGRPPVADEQRDDEARRLLHILLEQLPVKQSSAIAAQYTGLSRKLLYKMALSIKAENSDAD